MTRLFGLFGHAHDENRNAYMLRTMQKGGFGAGPSDLQFGHLQKIRSGNFRPEAEGPGGLIKPGDHSYWRNKARSPAANSQNPSFPDGKRQKEDPIMDCILTGFPGSIDVQFAISGFDSRNGNLWLTKQIAAF
jgi:hypothetical protein